MPYAVAALNVAQHDGDARRVVESLRLIGHVHVNTGQRKEATTVLRRALQHALPLGDDALTAACRNSLGTLLRYQGEYAEAHECFEQALGKIESVADAMAAGILFNLSLLARLRGHYDEARQLCVQAVDRVRVSHHLRKLGIMLVDFGELLLLTGNVDDGVTAISEALEINERVRDSVLADAALQQMGAAAVLRGRAGQARELLLRSLSVHHEPGGGDQADITLLWLVRACWLDGCPAQAASHFGRLLRLGENIRHYLLPSVLEEGAKLLHFQGQLPQMRLAIGHAYAMRNQFTLLRTPAEENMVLTALTSLQAEIGPQVWQEITNKPPQIGDQGPLQLLQNIFLE